MSALPIQTARPSARALETRERLFTAGRRAFARRGLAGTNLKADILAPAGVSVGSFYHQFKDKTELLLALLGAHSDLFRAQLRALQQPAPGRSYEQVARDSYELVFRVATENEDILRIQLRERDCEDERIRRFLREDRERWRQSLTADYRQLGEAGGRPELSEDAAELTLALAFGILARFLETPRADRDAARGPLIENLVRFTLGGLDALTEPAEPARR
jgi:AcrR family transcriptional regulator